MIKCWASPSRVATLASYSCVLSPISISTFIRIFLRLKILWFTKELFLIFKVYTLSKELFWNLFLKSIRIFSWYLFLKWLPNFPYKFHKVIIKIFQKFIVHVFKLFLTFLSKNSLFYPKFPHTNTKFFWYVNITTWYQGSRCTSTWSS